MISAVKTSFVCSVSARRHGQKRRIATCDVMSDNNIVHQYTHTHTLLTRVVHDVGGNLLWGDVCWDGDFLRSEGNLGIWSDKYNMVIYESM